jgi:nickel/cobalt transporter (NicO) family protein
MMFFARAFCLLLLLCVAPLGMAVPLLAQEQTEQAPPKIDQRKLLVQPRNADGTLKTPSFWREPALWIMDKQRSFYGAMSLSIRQMKSQSPYAAALTLMLLSFGYGVFHAAGPGHGKAVISAWLLATENELRRGILIAFMSAVVQALTAIAIVSALLLFVTAVGTTARDVAGFLESASYALIALMGAYLIWTACGRIGMPRRRRLLMSAIITTVTIIMAMTIIASMAPIAAAAMRMSPRPARSRASGRWRKRYPWLSPSASGPAPAPSWC